MEEKSSRKRIMATGLLMLALGLSSLGGIAIFSGHGNGSVPVAYANDCEGPNPPPDLDCPPTPTPTPKR